MDSIKKLDINMVLPPDIPQSSAMEWANRCYESYFREAIEKAVSSFDDSMDVIIPEIRIDLGTIEASEIPYQLERRLKDEIARHIRSVSMTGVRAGTDVDSLSGELTEPVSVHDGTRSSKERSAPSDELITEGQADMKKAHDKRAAGETLLLDDELAAQSEEIVREENARSVEAELFQAYLNYISEGYSDLEVLGRQYSLQEIAAMIEAVLVSSDHPGKQEQMSARLRQALKKHFPLSFFRMERTLPLPLFSRVILGPSEPSDSDSQEIIRMVETLIEERADSASVPLALFAISSFRVRQRTGRQIESQAGKQADSQTERQTGSQAESHIGRQAGIQTGDLTAMSLPPDSLDELTLFIRRLSTAASETVDPVLAAEDLEMLFENLPEKAVYRPLADALAERSDLSDILDEIKRIAQASVLEKKPEVRETEHRLFTEDAGLVLLHPFFRPLFNRLGLLDEQDKFLSIDHQVRAVHLLKCLAEGFEEAQDDNDLLFCKLLCGLPYEFLIDDEFRIKEQEKREIEDLFHAILEYWNPFKSSSHESMRQAFIKRKGAVERNEKGYVVRVAGSSIDILMDDLPWEISMIFLPWTSPFIVEWQKEQ